MKKSRWEKFMEEENKKLHQELNFKVGDILVSCNNVFCKVINSDKGKNSMNPGSRMIEVEITGYTEFFDEKDTWRKKHYSIGSKHIINEGQFRHCPEYLGYKDHEWIKY